MIKERIEAKLQERLEHARVFAGFSAKDNKGYLSVFQMLRRSRMPVDLYEGSLLIVDYYLSKRELGYFFADRAIQRIKSFLDSVRLFELSGRKYQLFQKSGRFYLADRRFVGAEDYCNRIVVNVHKHSQITIVEFSIVGGSFKAGTQTLIDCDDNVFYLVKFVSQTKFFACEAQVRHYAFWPEMTIQRLIQLESGTNRIRQKYLRQLDKCKVSVANDCQDLMQMFEEHDDLSAYAARQNDCLSLRNWRVLKSFFGLSGALFAARFRLGESQLFVPFSDNVLIVKVNKAVFVCVRSMGDVELPLGGGIFLKFVSDMNIILQRLEGVLQRREEVFA